MLKSITINNYKTFIHETSFDFSASKYTFLERENVGCDRILKGALFVGENASGKTNILKAILFLLQTFSGVESIDYMSMKSFYTPEKTFSIKYVFAQSDDLIEYRVVCDMVSIVEEELKLNGERYFTRKGVTAKVRNSDGSEDTVKGISGTLLYLRKLYFDTRFDDIKSLKEWAKFLERSIYINCLDKNLQGSPLIVNSILEGQYFEQNDTSKINDFFDLINYRQKVYYSNIVKTKTITFNYASKVISFEKDGTDVKVPSMYESTGNKTLIPVFLTFIHAIENDCILIVDEFSSGLHNELEECLLKYFFKKSGNSQLFFTTHSTNVLNNAILRPDQIYSVKFDGKNGSVVKRFSERDPMPRVAQNFEHMYLNGEFDGKPYYNSDF